jgi:septum formation inhibitor MinC
MSQKERDDVRIMHEAHEAELERMRRITDELVENIHEKYQEQIEAIEMEKEQYRRQMLLYKENSEADEAQLEKMKKLYDEQLQEVAEAFRHKNASLEAQLERVNKQLEKLAAG